MVKFSFRTGGKKKYKKKFSIVKRKKKESASKILSTHKHAKEWVAYFKPPRGINSPVPDTWITDLNYVNNFYSGAGHITANAMHFEFCPNAPYGVFSTLPNTTNSILNTDALCGQWQYPAGQFNNDGYPYVNTLALMYQSYIMVKTHVSFDVNLTTASDSLELVLAPCLNNTLTASGGAANTSYKEIALYKHAKHVTIKPFSSMGPRNMSISLGNTVNELLGTNFSVQEMIADGFGTQVGGNPSAAHLLGYILAFRTMDGVATTGVVSMSVRIKSQFAFYNPIQKPT